MPTLICCAIYFLLSFFISPFTDVVVGLLAGIFAGIPGIIGCAIGEFIYDIIIHTELTASLLYSVTVVLSVLVPFLFKRFLKDKSKIRDTWVYLGITVLTSLVASVGAVAISSWTTPINYWPIFCDTLVGFICISFAITYPIYFLIQGIRERNFKTGNSILNAFTIWLPIQYFAIMLFISKVYSIGFISANRNYFQILEDSFVANQYFLYLNIAIIIVMTLVTRFKRVMLFIMAGIMVVASVFNIITFDSSEGMYILIFMTLWLIIHAIFFNWYELKALKVKAFKIIKTVLHILLLGIYVLFISLCIATCIIPQAKGDERHVLVLGAPVIDNEASSILQDRITKASGFLSNNKDAFAILTGGTKVEGGKTEAEVMRDGIVKNGISPDRLILESGAKTTEENFQKSLAIIEQKGGNKDDILVITTSSFHLLRAGVIARHAGFTHIATLGADSFFLKEWNWYIRESITILPVILGK